KLELEAHKEELQSKLDSLEQRFKLEFEAYKEDMNKKVESNEEEIQKKMETNAIELKTIEIKTEQSINNLNQKNKIKIEDYNKIINTLQEQQGQLNIYLKLQQQRLTLFLEETRRKVNSKEIGAKQIETIREANKEFD